MVGDHAHGCPPAVEQAFDPLYQSLDLKIEVPGQLPLQRMPQMIELP